MLNANPGIFRSVLAWGILLVSVSLFLVVLILRTRSADSCGRDGRGFGNFERGGSRRGRSWRLPAGSDDEEGWKDEGEDRDGGGCMNVERVIFFRCLPIRRDANAPSRVDFR